MLRHWFPVAALGVICTKDQKFLITGCKAELSRRIQEVCRWHTDNQSQNQSIKWFWNVMGTYDFLFTEASSLGLRKQKYRAAFGVLTSVQRVTDNHQADSEKKCGICYLSFKSFSCMYFFFSHDEARLLFHLCWFWVLDYNWSHLAPARHSFVSMVCVKDLQYWILLKSISINSEWLQHVQCKQ